MPFCPKCRAEYREGFSRCSDCDVDLVDELPREEEDFEEEDLVPIHTFTGDLYAEMVKEALENAGISCILQKTTISTVTVVSGATEGAATQVLVRRSDVERAEGVMMGILDHI